MSNQTHLIDVRESYEFASQHIEGSINMPLSEFEQHVDTIKNMTGKKILFCRSGMRSSQALAYLSQLGIQNCSNGGGIMDVQASLAV